MKFLKNHGKKVSVVLLAMALMVTPMLNIVKAADDVTCTKKYHYFFLEAENGWIDKIYSTSENMEPSKSIVQSAYTTQYVMHFGWNKDTVESSSAFANDNYKNFSIDGLSIARSNGAYYALGNEKIDNPLLHNTVYDASGNGTWKLTDPSKESDSTVEGDDHTNYPADSKVSMSSTGVFYNYEVPSGYTKKSEEVKYTWTDEELELYAKMNVSREKVSDAKSSDLRIEDGDDVYFVHYNWTNNENGSTGAYYRSDGDGLKNSDEGALDDLFNDWAKYDAFDKNYSDVKSTLSNIKKSFIDISSTSTDPIAIANNQAIGDMKDNQISLTITRHYGDLSNKKPAFWQTNSKVMHDTTAGYYEQDYYHLYFFPAMYTVTFEGKGADVCNASVDTKDEDKEKNPDTGVASYAIIGTLLVGAASAYIYARKNNKFNRV